MTGSGARSPVSEAGRPRTPIYREQPPPPALKEMVECLWTLRSHGPLSGTRLLRVLPDGGSDIIWNLGDEPLPDGCPHHRLRVFAVGTMTAPAEFRLRGTVDFVGVRFRPGGATPFLGARADELRDGAVALAELWGDAAEAEERVAESDTDARVGTVAGLLARRGRKGPEPDARVLAAARWIEESGGRIAVAALARRAGTSARHLQRLFASHVGVPPKTACAVARFRRAARLAVRAEARPWTEIAFAAGYADQAHLSREFRRFAGVAPTQYRPPADVASLQDDVAPDA